MIKIIGAVFVSIALLGSALGAPKPQCAITIVPSPVVVGAPWSAFVSGLKPGYDSVVLGNGYNDGNWMFREFFVADSAGNIAVSPPVFEVQTIDGQVLDPSGSHDFQALHVNCSGQGVCAKSQLLCDQVYSVVGP